MGIYLCYNCNKEFWTLRGLTKHSEQTCPRITPEMRKERMKPFYRVISRVEYIEPTKKEPERETFERSYKVATNEMYDYKERLIENAIEIGAYLDGKRGYCNGKRIDKNELEN